jgi:hypothetical protein
MKKNKFNEHKRVFEDAAKKFRPVKKKWDKEEIALVEMFYNKVDINLLASRLGRSVSSVRIKALLCNKKK